MGMRRERDRAIAGRAWKPSHLAAALPAGLAPPGCL